MRNQRLDELSTCPLLLQRFPLDSTLNGMDIRKYPVTLNFISITGRSTVQWMRSAEDQD